VNHRQRRLEKSLVDCDLSVQEGETLKFGSVIALKPENVDARLAMEPEVRFPLSDIVKLLRIYRMTKVRESGSPIRIKISSGGSCFSTGSFWVVYQGQLGSFLGR